MICERRDSCFESDCDARMEAEEETKEIIKFFFAFPAQKIAEDLNWALDNRTVIEEYLWSGPDDRRKVRPAEIAKHYHYRLLRAYSIALDPGTHEDHGLFFAAHALDEIVSEAVLAAMESPGRMNELKRTMVGIARREGRDELEPWPLGTGPEEYRRLESKLNRLCGEKSDALSVQILRRYDFHEYARVYEDDELLFSVRYEAGRRSIPNKYAKHEAATDADRRLRKQFGERAIEMLYARLKEIEEWPQYADGGCKLQLWPWPVNESGEPQIGQRKSKDC